MSVSKVVPFGLAACLWFLPPPVTILSWAKERNLFELSPDPRVRDYEWALIARLINAGFIALLSRKPCGPPACGSLLAMRLTERGWRALRTAR